MDLYEASPEAASKAVRMIETDWHDYCC